MVKRNFRFGIRTSQTLKFGLNRMRINKFSKNKCTVIKYYESTKTDQEQMKLERDLVLENYSSLISDGGIQETRRENCVEYSLNKRKRWLLIPVVREGVHQLSSREKEDRLFDLSVTEHQVCPIAARDTSNYSPAGWERLQNTCVGYHDSSLQEPHLFPRKTFSFESHLRERDAYRRIQNKVGRYFKDLRKIKRIVTRGQQRNNGYKPCMTYPLYVRSMKRKRQYYMRILKEGSSVPTHPKIHYDIFQTHAPLGHRQEWDLTHKFKFGKETNNIGQRLRNCNQSKSWRKRKGRCKREFITTDIESDGEYNCLDEKENMHTEYRFPSVHVKTFCKLGDFLEENKGLRVTKRGHVHRQGRKHQNRRIIDTDLSPYKGKIIYCQHASMERSVTEQMPVHPKQDWVESDAHVGQDVQADCKPVCLRLFSDQLERCFLLETYGKDYLSGQSYPFRFAINIDSNLNRAKGKIILVIEIKDLTQNMSVDTMCFIQIHCQYLSVTEHGLLHAALQEQAKNYDISLNISDLTQIVLKYLECNDGLKPPSSPRTKLQPRTPKVRLCAVTDESKRNVSFEIYSLEEAFDILVQTEELESINRLTTCSDREKCAVIPWINQVCDICFECIGDDYSGRVNGTALIRCNHWFCHDCWRSHLANRFALGDLHLKCPAFKCESIVDPLTLLWYVSVCVYLKHLKQKQNAMIELNPEWKWCPNVLCQRVVKISSTANDKDQVERRIVNCDCGQIWCFDCQNSAHWPATCRQYLDFIKLVKSRGHDSGDIICHIPVRKCPTCQFPMQKGGGCSHMSCHNCRTSFCWDCLRPYTDHDYQKCRKGIKKETMLGLNDAVDGIGRGRFYFLALKHKRIIKAWSDQSMIKRAMSNTSNSLNLPLKRKDILMSRKKKVMKSTKLWQTIANQEDWTMSREKNDYITSIVSFMKQAHFTLLNVYILLRDCRKKDYVLLSKYTNTLEPILLAFTEVVEGKQTTTSRETVDAMMITGHNCLRRMFSHVKYVKLLNLN